MRSRLLGLLVALALVPTVCAQAAIELRIADPDAFVNEGLRVDIYVRNCPDCGAPEMPEIANCDVRFLTRTTHTSIVNFQQESAEIYAYELTPRTVGELVIPPIRVSSGRRELTTAERRIPVRASDAAELLVVQVDSPTRRAYVGQRIPLELIIWVKPFRDRARRVNLSQEDMRRLFTEASLGPFQGEGIRMGRREWQSADGTKQTYYTFEASTDYVPDRPGLLTFDGIVVGLNYPKTVSVDRFWGTPEIVSARSLRVGPDVAPIEIMPLPAEGRPANFTGAVGIYQISVGASPLAVRVGDPIELTIDIGGSGVLETLAPPRLDQDPLLTRLFRVPAEELAGQVVGKVKRFTQTIRARSADATEIPPIEYPYFDPDAREYRVARSSPLPLNVSAGESLATGEVVAAPVAPAATERSAHAVDGLRGIETGEAAVLARPHPLHVAQVLTATTVPAGVFLLSWLGVVGWRARFADPVARRRQSAGRTAHRRLAAARRLPPQAHAGAVHAALAGYLADRFNEPPGRLVGADAVRYLRERGAADPLLRQWAELIERCELAAFAASDAPAADGWLVDAAQHCLAAAERERL